METATDKDEWEAMNDTDVYQRIRSRYSQQIRKLYCIHKELFLIIFIYIFTSGGMLIYSISNLKFLETQVKMNSDMQIKRKLGDNLNDYSNLRNITDIRKINFKQISSSYLPYGPQSLVPLLSITRGGWMNCYLSSYGDEKSLEIDIIFQHFCTAPYLMIACKKRNSKYVEVLAWGGRGHILFQAENDFDFQVVQGTKWIYHNTSYIGFADPYDKVVIGVLDWNKKKNGQYLQVRCDTYSSLASFYGDYQNSSKRLCWPIMDVNTNKEGNEHINKTSLSFIGKGGTCLGNTWQNSDEWERLVFEREMI